MIKRGDLIDKLLYVFDWYESKSTVFHCVINKTKEDFSLKRGVGQQEKKALLVVEW